MKQATYNLTQEEYWSDKEVPCEICGMIHKATQLSTCDRCGRYVCDKCSEAVVNREENPYGFDFLCRDCIDELNKPAKAERKT